MSDFVTNPGQLPKTQQEALKKAGHDFSKPGNIKVDVAAKDAEKTKVVTSVSEIIPELKNVDTKDKEKTVEQLKKIVDSFHLLWYPLQGSVTWMGYELQKCPLDLWVYQEILWECKPDLIVECGTWKGGSALFLAHLCDIMGHGHILTIDINRSPLFPIHQRIAYATGSSTSKEVVEVVDGFAKSVRKVMVILDSDHEKQHVLDELHIYSHFVTPQQYLIVEDSNIHGHPVRTDLPAGPYEAINAFLAEDDNATRFKPDEMCERFFLTFNPKGYLRKIRA